MRDQFWRQVIVLLSALLFGALYAAASPLTAHAADDLEVPIGHEVVVVRHAPTDQDVAIVIEWSEVPKASHYFVEYTVKSSTSGVPDSRVRTGHGAKHGKPSAGENPADSFEIFITDLTVIRVVFAPPAGSHWQRLPTANYSDVRVTAVFPGSKKADVHLNYTSQSQKPGSTFEGETVQYALTATPSDGASSLTVTNTIPRDTTVVPGSITSGGVLNGRKITWNFVDTTGETVQFSLVTDGQKNGTRFITNQAKASGRLESNDKRFSGKGNLALRYDDDRVVVTATATTAVAGQAAPGETFAVDVDVSSRGQATSLDFGIDAPKGTQIVPNSASGGGVATISRASWTIPADTAQVTVQLTVLPRNQLDPKQRQVSASVAATGQFSGGVTEQVVDQFDLDLDLGGEIKGVVRDVIVDFPNRTSVTHPPLAGVRVELIDDQDQVVESVVTDKRGKYSVLPPKSGRYKVEVSKTGLRWLFGASTLGNDGEVKVAKFVDVPPPGASKKSKAIPLDLICPAHLVGRAATLLSELHDTNKIVRPTLVTPVSLRFDISGVAPLLSQVVNVDDGPPWDGVYDGVDPRNAWNQLIRVVAMMEVVKLRHIENAELVGQFADGFAKLMMMEVVSDLLDAWGGQATGPSPKPDVWDLGHAAEQQLVQVLIDRALPSLLAQLEKFDKGPVDQANIAGLQGMFEVATRAAVETIFSKHNGRAFDPTEIIGKVIELSIVSAVNFIVGGLVQEQLDGDFQTVLGTSAAYSSDTLSVLRDAERMNGLIADRSKLAKDTAASALKTFDNLDHPGAVAAGFIDLKVEIDALQLAKANGFATQQVQALRKKVAAKSRLLRKRMNRLLVALDAGKRTSLVVAMAAPVGTAVLNQTDTRALLGVLVSGPVAAKPSDGFGSESGARIDSPSAAAFVVGKKAVQSSEADGLVTALADLETALKAQDDAAIDALRPTLASAYAAFFDLALARRAHATAALEGQSDKELLDEARLFASFGDALAAANDAHLAMAIYDVDPDKTFATEASRAVKAFRRSVEDLDNELSTAPSSPVVGSPALLHAFLSHDGAGPVAAGSQIIVTVELRNFGGTVLAAGDAALIIASNASSASAAQQSFGSIASGASTTRSWVLAVDPTAAGDAVEWSVEIQVGERTLVLREFVGVNDTP